MAVVLPNAQVTARVRSHEWERDARGVPLPTGRDTITVRGPYPGNITKAEGATYACRLDPRMNPLRIGDELETADGDVFTITEDPVFHKHAYGLSLIDFIEASATKNDPEVL